MVANLFRCVRGSGGDRDDWASLVEDPSWSSSEIKQYLMKHQTLEPFDEKIPDRSTMPLADSFRGTEGPVQTSSNDSRLPIEDHVINAAEEITALHKKPLDQWSGDQIGFFSGLGTVVGTGPEKDKRNYAACVHFERNKRKPNLKVLCKTFATGVILENKTATGLTFTHGGQIHKVAVEKEVILSGGVFAT